jgi:hypothetical protein
VIAKFGVPVFDIFTVSAALPVSLTEKLLDSLAAVLRKVICLKPRLAGATFIWLNGAGIFFAWGWTSWAAALIAAPIVKASATLIAMTKRKIATPGALAA